MSDAFQIFLVVPPGLEQPLADEARAQAFKVTRIDKGGVTISGNWQDVWRANLKLRGATRVLARLTEFHAVHLSQLDKRARKLPWDQWLRPDLPVKVDATCRASKIYHDRAAAQRIETAITETLGAPISKDAALTLKVRIENNLVTLSLDTSGEALHKRGHKTHVNKAPMRETLAANFLRLAGYTGAETVYDPMCGSGTFPIEAAEIANGIDPGRSRSFAFEHLASFDPDCFAALTTETTPSPLTFYGSDRDAGAIKMSRANAERAGLSQSVRFDHKSISDIVPPQDSPGLVILNPPYGARIGNKKPLFGLYGSFGSVMRERFQGWRVALITSDPGLAKATELPFRSTSQAIDHGGIRIKLYQSDVL